MHTISARIIHFTIFLSLVLQGYSQSNVSGDHTKALTKQILDAIQGYKNGDLKGAVARFENLHLEDPKNSDVCAWLGFLYLKSNNSGRALPLLQSALAQRPNDLEVANNLGNAYLAAGKFDLALAQYTVIEKMDSKMFEPHYNSGTIYLRRHNYPAAIQELTKASFLNPKDAFVHNNLAIAYQNSHDDHRASEEFIKANALRPDSLLFVKNAGLSLAREGRHREAIVFLEKVVKGTDPAVSLTLADSYSRVGRRKDALNFYETLKSSQSENSTFWFNLAVLRSEFGNSNGAEEAYKRVLSLTPNDLDALNNFGLLQFKRGNFAEAETLFDRLCGLNPSSINAKMNLAAACVKTGNAKRAAGIWKAVLHGDVNNLSLRLDLANALWDSGDFEGAHFHYLEVLKRDKNNFEALNGVGLYYLRASKLAPAEAAFRSSIESNAKFIPAYNNLALTLERMNRKSLAINTLEHAAKLDPNDAEVKRNLRRLKA